MLERFTHPVFLCLILSQLINLKQQLKMFSNSVTFGSSAWWIDANPWIHQFIALDCNGYVQTICKMYADLYQKMKMVREKNIKRWHHYSEYIWRQHCGLVLTAINLVQEWVMSVGLHNTILSVLSFFFSALFFLLPSKGSGSEPINKNCFMSLS